MLIRAVTIDDIDLLIKLRVDFLATEDGKPLYEKFGFVVPVYTPMRIKFQHGLRPQPNVLHQNHELENGAQREV